MILLGKTWRHALLGLALFSRVAAAASPCPPKAEAISFSTADGTTLRGEVLSPCGAKPETQLPAVLFMNPFGQPYVIYEAQAQAFAEDGYRVLRYDQRGWQSSEGQTSLDYSVLTDDARRALDWLTSNYATTRIGAAGISEGAGLALLLSAKEPRLSAAASLSGWTDLAHTSLGDTPRLTWNAILGTVLILFGDPSSLIEDAIRRAQQNPPPDPAEGYRRISPWYFLAEINARKVPILLTHDFDDTLFPVNQVVEFFRALAGPKHLALNRGFHAASELLGLPDAKKAPYLTLHRWFDAYVKNAQPSELDGQLTIAYKNQASILKLKASEWKDADASVFYLVRNEAGYALSAKPEPSAFQSDLHVETWPSDNSGVTTGTPLFSALNNLLTLATVEEPTGDSIRPYAIQFSSNPLNEAQDVDGSPRLNLKLHSETDRGMVIAHLIDIAPDESASLITNGVYTWSSKDRTPDGTLRFTIQLYTTAWRLERGHRLGMTLHGADAEYQPPTLLPYHYDLDPAAGSLRLDVPLIKAQ